MNVPVNFPGLLASELPEGIDPARVVARKEAIIAAGPGSSEATAEMNAIQAEQIQVQRDAWANGPGGTPDAVNRRPFRVIATPPPDPQEETSSASTEEVTPATTSPEPAAPASAPSAPSQEATPPAKS